MNEENIKLAKVKKSCKALRIVTRIVAIACIVGCVLATVSGLAIMLTGQKFDDAMMKAMETGDHVVITTEGVTTADDIANNGKTDVVVTDADLIPTNMEGNNAYVKFGDLDPHKIMDMEVESSIPALNDYMQTHKFSMVYGTYCTGVGILIGLLAVVMSLLASTFAFIEKADTPFDKKVQKKVLISMIVLSVTLFFTAGTGFAVICGLLTWAVYTILDYGLTLQTQVDETL